MMINIVFQKTSFGYVKSKLLFFLGGGDGVNFRNKIIYSPVFKCWRVETP